MTCQPDILWKAVRVLLPLEFHPDSSVCVREFYFLLWWVFCHSKSLEER